MVGLPPDVDLDFLMGRCLNMLEIGPFTFNLCLDRLTTSSNSKDERVRIMVKTEFSYTLEGKGYAGQADKPATVAPLIAFLSEEIRDVQRIGRGDISLKFQQGGEICIKEGDDGYESYEIFPVEGGILVV